MTTLSQVQIVDGIGAHSGMQAYNTALALSLASGGWRVAILSNYLDECFRNADGLVLPNFYVGSIAGNVRRMFACGLAVYRYARRADNEDTLWLLQFHGATLGNLIFFLALAMGSKRRRLGLIVHDVTSVHQRENRLFWAIKKAFYRHAPRLLIVHSAMAAEQLQQMGYRGALLQSEHFRASGAAASASEQPTDGTLASLLASPRRRVLLFGSIRASKGLDTALSALRQLPPPVRDSLLLVVAGRDSGGILGTQGHEIPDDGSVVVLDRFISNEERASLFAGAALILLPYRSIYQSGVLDFAVHHRVRVLASDLPPFRQFFDEFPSFGQVFGQTAAELARSLQEAVAGDAVGPFYLPTDLLRYAASDPAATFPGHLRDALAQVG